MPSIAARQYEYRDAKKACANCGGFIKLINMRDLVRKRFCSPACKAASQLGKRAVPIFREARKCSSCGIDYIANAKKQTFCSSRCRGKIIARRSLARHNDRLSHIKRLIRYHGRQHLTLEQIESLFAKQDGKCALTGIPMTWETLAGIRNTNLSLDRISPDRGYELANIQLVCRIANIMKHNLSQVEFVRLCQLVVANAE